MSGTTIIAQLSLYLTLKAPEPSTNAVYLSRLQHIYAYIVVLCKFIGKQCTPSYVLLLHCLSSRLL